ncbi:MAG: imidazolonepropionase [Ignavibacteriae bacterium]|nr:imidazolonepropionase [Ignavibacteriota bacterium]
MKTLFTNISSLVTANSNGAIKKCGKEMSEIGEIKDGALLIDEKIIWAGTTEEAEIKLQSGEFKLERVVNMNGKTILPGFVDSHTHIVFAGDRSNEFAKRLRGATYQEIAAEGGGILATVNAVRNSSIDELVENGYNIAMSAIRYGTTSMEIKSGYGLDLKNEIKMLEAIKELKSKLPITIKSTFLGAHDFPPEYKNNRDKYIDLICNEMLPAVAEQKLADYCDAFVDKGYYTIEQGERIFRTALDLGLKLKVHADELADVSAASLAARMGAVSADHLLFISDKGIADMKQAGTIVALLPGTAYFIRMPYAPARKMIEEGLAVALATDCNPGSCFTENMQMILSLAVINMKMTAEEAITATTLNGAAALELSDKMGSLEPGKEANFIVCDTPSYTNIFYHFGVNHVKDVYVRGDNVINN